MKRMLFFLAFIISFVSFSQNYKYLGPYTSDGNPQYFVAGDVVSKETLNLRSNTLPENYPSQGCGFLELIPKAEIFIHETTFVLIPAALMGVTSNKQVYFVDYYQNKSHVGSDLVTVAISSIYCYSNEICIHLNNYYLDEIKGNWS